MSTPQGGSAQRTRGRRDHVLARALAHPQPADAPPADGGHGRHDRRGPPRGRRHDHAGPAAAAAHADNFSADSRAVSVMERIYDEPAAPTGPHAGHRGVLDLPHQGPGRHRDPALEHRLRHGGGGHPHRAPGHHLHRRPGGGPLQDQHLRLPAHREHLGAPVVLAGLRGRLQRPGRHALDRPSWPPSCWCRIPLVAVVGAVYLVVALGIYQRLIQRSLRTAASQVHADQAQHLPRRCSRPSPWPRRSRSAAPSRYFADRIEGARRKLLDAYRVIALQRGAAPLRAGADHGGRGRRGRPVRLRHPLVGSGHRQHRPLPGLGLPHAGPPEQGVHRLQPGPHGHPRGAPGAPRPRPSWSPGRCPSWPRTARCELPRDLTRGAARRELPLRRRPARCCRTCRSAWSSPARPSRSWGARVPARARWWT